VSRYQKAKTNPDFTEVRDIEWQWHQLSHMQVCISLQTDNHASTAPIFTGQMPFLTPNQQRQSTEGMTSMLLYLISAVLNMFTCFCCRIRCNDAFQVGRRHALFLCSRVFRTFVYHFFAI